MTGTRIWLLYLCVPRRLYPSPRLAISSRMRKGLRSVLEPSAPTFAGLLRYFAPSFEHNTEVLFVLVCRPLLRHPLHPHTLSPVSPSPSDLAPYKPLTATSSAKTTLLDKRSPLPCEQRNPPKTDTILRLRTVSSNLFHSLARLEETQWRWTGYRDHRAFPFPPADSSKEQGKDELTSACQVEPYSGSKPRSCKTWARLYLGLEHPHLT